MIGESEAIPTMQIRNNGGARLVVTSASGANGNGCGTLLAFDRAGAPLGAFSDDDRIADPRGLAVDRQNRLLYSWLFPPDLIPQATSFYRAASCHFLGALVLLVTAGYFWPRVPVRMARERTRSLRLRPMGPGSCPGGYRMPTSVLST